jgi:DNA-directed RNA polymerase specialized sigma24 family protein
MAANVTFEELYAEQFTYQVRHVQGRYGLTYDEAQDIVQVACICLWDEHPNLADLPSPGGYLRRQVDYQVKDFFRGRKRHLSIDLPVSSEEEEPLSESLEYRPAGPTLEEQVMTQIELEQIAHQVRHLPLIDQIILGLTTQGYSHEEIYQHLVQQYGFTGKVSRINTVLAQVRQELKHELRRHRQVQKTKKQLSRRVAHARWSRDHVACIQCGTTKAGYAARGLCKTCYSRKQREEEKTQIRIPVKRSVLETIQRWSLKHEACLGCGTTTIKHRSQGYCERCYRPYVRNLREGVVIKPKRRRVVSLFR